MNDCLFCKLAADSTGLIWENQDAVAFRDIHPKAPIHILVVSKQHIARLDDLSDAALAGRLLLAVSEVAELVGVKGAYKVHLNNGRTAGQLVDHLHFHILAGLPGHLDATA